MRRPGYDLNCIFKGGYMRRPGYDLNCIFKGGYMRRPGLIRIVYLRADIWEDQDMRDSPFHSLMSTGTNFN